MFLVLTLWRDLILGLQYLTEKLRLAGLYLNLGALYLLCFIFIVVSVLWLKFIADPLVTHIGRHGQAQLGIRKRGGSGFNFWFSMPLMSFYLMYDSGLC